MNERELIETKLGVDQRSRSCLKGLFIDNSTIQFGGLQTRQTSDNQSFTSVYLECELAEKYIV